jgi:hypothetical protein
MKPVKEIAKNFNLARMQLKNNVELLDREDVTTIVNASGFPKGTSMISHCIKWGIIEKHGNNKYTLPNNPVYYQKIGNAIDAYHKQRNVTAARYRARIARDVQKSTAFLEKHGYQVIGVK